MKFLTIWKQKLKNGLKNTSIPMFIIFSFDLQLFIKANGRFCYEHIERMRLTSTYHLFYNCYICLLRRTCGMANFQL